MSEKKFEAKVITVTEDGQQVTYKRTDKGYCSRDGRRVSAEAFRAAEDAHDAELMAQIEDNIAWAEATIAKAKGEVPEGIDPDGFAEWMADQPAERWDEEEAVEVTPEVPEPVVGNTEAVYSDEAVPAKPQFDIPGVRKDQATVGHVDGHEYVHDWFGKRYYRDGEEISKFEYEHEAYGRGAGKESGDTPKAARRRKPKDVAFEHDGVTLTAKQADFLREVGTLTEDDLLGNVHGGVWCDVLCDVIGGQFAGKPMSVGAMLSTICEKGLGERCKERREDGTGTGRGKLVTMFRLTEAGEAVWEAMGL